MARAKLAMNMFVVFASYQTPIRGKLFASVLSETRGEWGQFYFASQYERSEVAKNT